MKDIITQLVEALEESRRWIGDGECADGLHRDLWTPQYAAAVDKVDAALSAAKGGGWLPIETAPKDGTPIMLARGCRVTSGHWEPERWPICAEYHSSTGEYLGAFETGECIAAWWYSEDGGFDDEQPPTYWMPLPNPPKESA